MTIRESKRADSLSHCGLTDAVTARSLPVTAAYINYCFITGHILWAFISSITHSSLFISWFICAIFHTWIISKLSRGTSSPACWWMGNSVDRKPVFSSPSSGLVHRAFPITGLNSSKNESIETWLLLFLGGLYILQIEIFFPESSIMSTNNPSQVEYVLCNVWLTNDILFKI